MSSDWNKLTVVQLKGALSRRGLGSDGTKETLVKRLKDYEEEQAASAKKEAEEPMVVEEEEKEEPVVDILYKNALLSGYAAMTSLRTVQVSPFKREYLQHEGFTTWLDECKSYTIKKTADGENCAELIFATVEKGDAAFVDLKSHLSDIQVTHPCMTTFYSYGIPGTRAARLGIRAPERTSFFRRLIHLKGLSPNMNTEEKLAEFFPEAKNAISYHYSKQCPGHAILEFESMFEANKYLESVGKEISIDDETIQVDRYQIKQEPSVGVVDKLKLHVRNIPFRKSEEQVKSCFPKCIKLHRVLKRNRKGVKTTWAADLEFENEEDAKKALEKKDNLDLGGKVIVDFANRAKLNLNDAKPILSDEERIELNTNLNTKMQELAALHNSDESFGIEKVIKFCDEMKEYMEMGDKLFHDTNVRAKVKDEEAKEVKELPEPKDEMWPGTKFRWQLEQKKEQEKSVQDEILDKLFKLDCELLDNDMDGRYMTIHMNGLEDKLTADLLAKREKRKRAAFPDYEGKSGQGKQLTALEKITAKRQASAAAGSNGSAGTAGGVRKFTANTSFNRNRNQKSNAVSALNRMKLQKAREDNRMTGGKNRGMGGQQRVGEWRSPQSSSGGAGNDNRRKRAGNSRDDYVPSKMQRGNARSRQNSGGRYNDDRWSGGRRDNYSDNRSSIIQGITTALSDKMKQLEQLQKVTLQSQQQLMGGYGGSSAGSYGSSMGSYGAGSGDYGSAGSYGYSDSMSGGSSGQRSGVSSLMSMGQSSPNYGSSGYGGSSSSSYGYGSGNYSSSRDYRR